MAATYSHETILAAVDDEAAAWQKLVETVGPQKMEIPGAAGTWTFKDVAAHLSFWMEDIILTLESVANDEDIELPVRWPEHLTDPEEINTWAYEQSRDRSVDDVLNEAEEGFARMRRAIELIPEETLHSPDIFDWQQGEPFAQWLIDRRLWNHFHREHELEIADWLAENR